MNTFTKVLVIIAMIVVAALLNTYAGLWLEGTKLESFSIGQAFIVPICFLIYTWMDKKRKYTPMKRFAIVTVTLTVYNLVGNFLKWEKIMNNLIPMLCGALIVYLILFYKSNSKA